MLLVLSALAAPLLAGRAAAFGERVYDSNTVVPIGDPFFLVWSGESVAQSFKPAATYVLLNVTLRLRNLGNNANAVNITIRPDSGGVPSTSVFAGTDIVAPGGVGPVNVPLTPAVTVTQGARYWIVAAKGGALGNAYEWHHSNGNTSADGKAMTNVGSGWTNSVPATDMWFLTYGREVQANITVGMASTARAQPKDIVLFTIYLNNTGTQAARTVWLNDTLPSGFTYISDTAGSIPAITGYPNYTFANLANGPHSFTMTVQVRTDVAPGTALTNLAALAYTDAAGVPRPPSAAQATVVVGLQWKQLYLVPGTPGPPQSLVPKPPTGPQVVYEVRDGGAAFDFQLTAPLSRPLRVLSVTPVLYLDSKTGSTRNLDMNFTLLDVVGATQTAIWFGQTRVTTDNKVGFQVFSFSYPATDLNFSPGHQVLLRIQNKATASDNALLATNATATQSKMDLLTSTYVRVDSLQLRDGAGPATVWSPMDSLVVWANVSDPFGTSEIAAAWINITDPSGALVRNFTAMSILSSGSGWKLFNASVSAPLTNGTYRIEVIAKEGNGALAYTIGSGLVRAPDIRPALVPSQPSALSGDTFTYTIWYNNTGSGPAAQVWVNLTLASEVTFVTSSAEANRTGPTNWTWTNVAVPSSSFLVQVRVRSGIPPVPSMSTTTILTSRDEKGYFWPARTASAGVILQGPILSLAFTTSRPATHSNDTLVLSSTLRNTGELAGTVWLNLTWSAGLAYISDTAGSVGGTSTVRPDGVDIRWTNQAPGASFTLDVTVRTGSGLSRGFNLTIAVGLNYTNARGAIMPPQAAGRSVTVIAPVIVNATIWVGQATATPGDTVPARVSFSNVGDEPALSLVVTLALDAALSVRDASVAHTISGSAALFVFSNVGVGPRWIFLNLTVARGATDRDVLSLLGSVVYTDWIANPMAPVSATPTSMSVAAPALHLAGSPSVTTVEAGTRVAFRIDPSNLGSGPARDVWLNATLPLNLLFVSDSSDGERSAMGPRVTWYWPAFGMGSRAFDLTLALRSGALDGDTEDVALAADYADSNGNLAFVPEVILRASFVGPRLQLTLERSAEAVPTQTSFQYTLHVRNVGATIAKTVWLVDSVDDGLKVISYTSKVQPTGASDLNWTYENLQPNEEQIIILNVQVKAGVAVGTVIPNFITAVFTNSQGQSIGAAQSNAVLVTVIEATSPLPFVGAVAVAAAGAGLGVVVYRRRGSRIEEVFLTTRDGILIEHLARNLVQDKDPDIVSGMLMGIQRFVREAFKFGEDHELHQMEFGDRHILFERGEAIIMAAVTSGGDSRNVGGKLKKALAQIESEFGDVLAKFDGSMDQILGVQERLRERLLH
jgi:uncharacterized repeat protein (TIGR01451 family)